MGHHSNSTTHILTQFLLNSVVFFAGICRVLQQISSFLFSILNSEVVIKTSDFDYSIVSYAEINNNFSAKIIS